MDRGRLLEDAALEIRRLRELQANWHAVRSKLETQIKHLECQREAAQWPARSPENTTGEDPYSRAPNTR